ncbi:MAG: type 2 isopentenyl-diphosphate Delta-isomerase, partial [Candidatus Diapherotrites archaeon]|nr:type 2 isopentenyl-diphosphate Delta-isomerase [Candidatus Diapherotrites archaeon]
PTAACVVEVRSATDKLIIATGGMRSGIDAAKSIALGADVAAYALPVIRAQAKGGVDAVKKQLNTYVGELRVAMFNLGCQNPSALREVPRVYVGNTESWLRQRGLLS